MAARGLVSLRRRHLLHCRKYRWCMRQSGEAKCLLRHGVNRGNTLWRGAAPDEDPHLLGGGGSRGLSTSSSDARLVRHGPLHLPMHPGSPRFARWVMSRVIRFSTMDTPPQCLTDATRALAPRRRLAVAQGTASASGDARKRRSGTVAPRITLSTTLPNNALENAPRGCVGMTIRSAVDSAAARMAGAAWS